MYLLSTRYRPYPRVRWNATKQEVPVELFVHAAGSEHPEIIEIQTSALVREILAREDSDGRIWVEEADEEVDLDITLEAARIGHRHHVHRGRCRRIEVAVRFNGNYERSYSPAATIATVEKWAFGHEVANFSPEQAAKHVLAVPGADHFLEGGVHVGSLVVHGSCKVVLDLLPRSRFAG
jgi:hypothetical protein